MFSLPSCFAPVILTFAPLFFQRSWRHAEALLIGAILAPGVRTVASVLRIIGLKDESRFVNYHRVLNRASWCARLAGRHLLRLLLDRFVPDGPVVLGLDDTIERRWGRCIQARGIYRDPVRSSDAHFVKTSGLRWLSLMLLTPIPWAGRVWALPFLTVLAPSQRSREALGKRHKKLTDWSRQMVLQARAWLPKRDLVLVADSAFAALELLSALVRKRVTCITRLRLDAALYEPAPPRMPGAKGRPPKKGKRLPKLSAVLEDPTTHWRRMTITGWYGSGEREIECASGTAVWFHSGLPPVTIRWVLLRDPENRFDPQALLCTDIDQEVTHIIQWFVRRWQVEVTFQETRAHLGVETQRQWSDKAIARTTPCLLGLFSIVTLLADRLDQNSRMAIASAAWYQKPTPTFSDTLAAVRRRFWRQQGFFTSAERKDNQKIRPSLQNAIEYAICQAA